jgi:hypothetical protein
MQLILAQKCAECRPDGFQTQVLTRNDLTKSHLVAFPKSGQDFLHISFESLRITRFEAHPLVFHFVPKLFDAVEFRLGTPLRDENIFNEFINSLIH